MHPSNRYARQAQTQRTLRDLIASKSALLPSVRVQASAAVVFTERWQAVSARSSWSPGETDPNVYALIWNPRV
jgi:hypothetical protein